MVVLSATFKKIYAMTVASQLFVMLGVILGYSAYLFPQWHTHGAPFTVTKEIEWLIGVTNIGLRPLGVLIDIIAVDKWGRRGTLRIIFSIFVIGWILTGLALNLEMFLTGRFINSILVGMVTSPNLYVCEVSSGNLRATFIAGISPLMTLATALTYLLMYALRWKLTAFVIAIHSLATLASLYVVPESAYWYVVKGRKDEAVRSLQWFDRDGIEERLKIIEESVSLSDITTIFSNKWTRLRQATTFRRFLTLMSLACLSQFTGYLVIPNDAIQFFNCLHSDFDENILTVTYGFLCFFCDLISIVLLNKCRRKSLIIWPCVGMLTCVTVALILQILVADRTTESSTVRLYGKISILAVFGYSAFAHVGFNEVVWVLVPELFPADLRAIVFTSMYLVFFASMIIVFYLYPIIVFYFDFVLIGEIFVVCLIAVILIALSL